MGSIRIAACEEPCPRAGRVEHRDVRVGGFDDGEGEGFSGGRRRGVDFYRDVSCEKIEGLGLVEIIEELEGGEEDILLGVEEGRGKCGNRGGGGWVFRGEL